MDYPQLLQGIFPAWSFDTGASRQTVYAEFFDKLAGLQEWAARAGKREPVGKKGHAIYLLPQSMRSQLDEWLSDLTEIRDRLNPAGAKAIARRVKVPIAIDHAKRIMVTSSESAITRRLSTEDTRDWLMQLVTQTLKNDDLETRRLLYRLIDVVEASSATAWRIVRPTKGTEVRARVHTVESLKARPGTPEAKPLQTYLHVNGIFLLADNIKAVEVHKPSSRPRQKTTAAFLEPLLYLDKLTLYPVRPDGKPDHSVSFCPIR